MWEGEKLVAGWKFIELIRKAISNLKKKIISIRSESKVE